MKTMGSGRMATPEVSPTLHVLGRVRCAAAVLGALFTTACSVISPSASTVVTPASKITISVQPASVSLVSGAKTQFSAILSNTGSTGVIWTASAGSISGDGVFVAPKVTTATSIHLTATSSAYPSLSADAVVSVAPPGSSLAHFAITTASLPQATQGAAYSAVLAASGGQTPYSWTAAGSLPNGLQLNSNGTLRGTATQTGTFNITVSATDANGQKVTQSYSVSVAAAVATGSFDGPAELPRVYIDSSMAATPAPGSTISVNAGGDLQAALDSAQCGDTIALQAGASFSGYFIVPAKSCDDAHWIIVRTDAPDSALPPEGSRINPCYAGVASLPGRPAFSCPSVNNVMAKIVFEGIGDQPLGIANGANHYRFLGLEITRTSPGQVIYDLVSMQGTAAYLVFDRDWLHGTAHDETTRGIGLSGSTYVSVVDSYFSDFHCVALTGACGDSQAISGGLGNNPMGPYKIVDNYLEASGENLMFGGGEATQVPQDIEIRLNHLYKPMIWMRGQAGFVGGSNGNPFIVKNHIELKNGVRMLFEGNVLENTWGGFTQAGNTILLTPKNQGGNCAVCTVHDITIRYSTTSHMGGGIVIGDGASDSGALSAGAWNESIHDVVIDDVDATAYNGYGHLLQETNANPQTPIHDVVINHITGLTTGSYGMLVVGADATNPKMANFSWTNNILAAGSGLLSTGGGSANCASAPGGATAIFGNCFQPYAFNHNVLIAAYGNWPAGNFEPPSAASVGFVDLAQGNYQLQPSSPYKAAGSDGMDLGADVATLTTMIAGVQ
jgi:hypothetical protein